MPQPVARVVALGASNLTRGLQTIVATARAEWGPDVEILAALGHGRSYGAPSSFLCRTLPGILHSGLWTELRGRPPARTRALITDVGNDILYGFSAAQIVGWVNEAVARLQRVTSDVVACGLPVENIDRISARRFVLFRSLFFPRCSLSLAEVRETALRVNDAIVRLGDAGALTLRPLRPDWYGFDPIHIRSAKWPVAWREVLLGHSEEATPVDWLEAAGLYCLRPEEQVVCGLPWGRPQGGGRTLPKGGRLWLF